MFRYLLRKIIVFLTLLFLANFIGFSYARIALQLNRAESPFGSSIQGNPSVFFPYLEYLGRAFHLDFGLMPVMDNTPIITGILSALGASFGLLSIAFVLSTFIGLIIGLNAIHVDPPSIASWLTPISSFGMAIPGFYFGILLIVATVIYLTYSPPDTKPLLPIIGFGWDAHLILPVLSLIGRPILQTSQFTSRLITSELGKQYVITERAIGRSWNIIRWKHVLKNVIAPLIVHLAGSFRLLLAELVLVEWLFQWTGIGRLLALTLIPPGGASPVGIIGITKYFLHPDLLPALITLFTLILLITEGISSFSIWFIDPRYRNE
jgi:peptide/nickel transport system permease protein